MDEQTTQSYQYDNVETAEILNHISTDKEFEHIFEIIVGVKFDKILKKWVKLPYFQPLVNTEEGISWCLRTVRTYMTTSTTYNDFSEKRIHLQMTDFRDNYLLPTLLNSNACEKYGIDDINIDEVSHQLSQIVFKLLNRSLDAGERSSLTQSLKAVESVKTSQSTNNGIISKLFGGKNE